MKLAIWLIFFSGVIYAADSAPAGVMATSKAESYLLLPEPRVMGSSISQPFADSKHTVFTPAHQRADGKLHVNTREEFAKLGLSWETFLERAQAAADRRLTELQPELKKDASGKVLYAVYRSDEPTMACLLIAPTLSTIFKTIFGDEIWLVSPDRHSLFVFPARHEAIEEFADDLRSRFEDNPYAASDEIFDLKNGAALRVIGNFSGAR
ncbi:MAG: hypothetical protein K8R87_12590 [Verrucomicrobia bacterium]|nr:hypothetical protein [Verrucomicrobiota bacterium]